MKHKNCFRYKYQKKTKHDNNKLFKVITIKLTIIKFIIKNKNKFLIKNFFFCGFFFFLNYLFSKSNQLWLLVDLVISHRLAMSFG